MYLRVVITKVAIYMLLLINTAHYYSYSLCTFSNYCMLNFRSLLAIWLTTEMQYCMQTQLTRVRKLGYNLPVTGCIMFMQSSNPMSSEGRYNSFTCCITVIVHINRTQFNVQKFRSNITLNTKRLNSTSNLNNSCPCHRCTQDILNGGA